MDQAHRCTRIPKDEWPLAINGFAFPGYLVDTLGQIQCLQRQFQRRSALTLGFGAEPLGDRLDHRQIRQRRQHVLGRYPLTGRHRRTALDRGHQRTDVETTERAGCGVSGGATQQVFQNGLLAALLAGLEFQLAAQHSR